MGFGLPIKLQQKNDFGELIKYYHLIHTSIIGHRYPNQNLLFPAKQVIVMKSGMFVLYFLK